MAVGPPEHKRFCEIDGWQELKSARGKKRDHDSFRKTLANGDVLQTRVSRNKKQYGEDFWRMIWRDQFGLESEEQFWEVLRTKKPVRRSQDRPPPSKPGIAPWLIERLLSTVKLPQEEIAKMTPEEAQARWEAYQRGDTESQ